MPDHKNKTAIARKPIPYGRQDISDADIAAVERVLRSDYLTQGPEIARFEEAFANYVGSDYAVAVANGTAALHLCALALDVKPGQKVITTPITFAASANCVRYCGGEVVFGDIDPETYLLDVHHVRRLLEAAHEGTYAGIIPVDFAGRSVDLEAFRQLADEFNLWIIEDACHAPGGYFTDSDGIDQRCGNGQYADLAIFSFHPVKHIAAGEGGMITTNNEKLYQKLLALRTHGIVKDPSGEAYQNPVELALGQTPHSALATQNYPGWYMEMQTLGYNYRLTDFQAALGNSQLQRADEGLARRHQIAARYAEAFKSIDQIRDVNRSPFTVHGSPQDTVHRSAVHRSPIESHAFHLYVVEAESRITLYNYLRDHNIFAQIHYIPLHLMPYYQQQGWKPGDFPFAENYYSRCISLPMFPTLTNDEQDYVIECIRAFYAENNHNE